MAEGKIDPPLVDLKVTNPITYLKNWWAKIIGNEGVDVRLHIHPLTAIIIALAVASIGFGVGRFVMPFSIPFFKYEAPTPKPNPPSATPDSLKDTAYTGTLQYSEATKKYYLLTTSSEAITLQVPTSINLSGLVGKRIFAAGIYSKTQRILTISDAKNMEVLPKTPVPIPTTNPTPSPMQSPTASPSPSTSLYSL